MVVVRPKTSCKSTPRCTLYYFSSVLCGGKILYTFEMCKVNELNISWAYISKHHTLPDWYLLSHIRFLSKYFQNSRSKKMNFICSTAIIFSFMAFH